MIYIKQDVTAQLIEWQTEPFKGLLQQTHILHLNFHFTHFYDAQNICSKKQVTYIFFLHIFSNIIKIRSTELSELGIQ